MKRLPKIPNGKKVRIIVEGTLVDEGNAWIALGYNVNHNSVIYKGGIKSIEEIK